LDLACGTGQVALALAGNVGEVWAVDQEGEAIEYGRRKAERLGVSNVRWIVGSAEDVELDGAFDLVTIGNAFHRLDREAVVRRLVPYLTPHGCVALLWGGTPWHGDQPWQRALHGTLERWRDVAGVRDRVPEGWEQAIERDPHPQVLRRAGLVYERLHEVVVAHRWSVESLVGFVYSTSFLNRVALGTHVDAFEADLRRELLACCPDGVFDQALIFAYELARRDLW
jgi:SAM-dependent methyltransferase